MSIKNNILSFKIGRINRLPFFIYTFTLLIINLLYFNFLDPVIPNYLSNIIQTLFLIIFVYLMIERYHDMDKQGLWVLLLLIPVLGAIIVSIQLLFVKGTKGKNKYGLDKLTKQETYYKKQ